MKTKGKIRLLSLSMLILLSIILIGCSKPTQEETQNQSNTVTDKEGNVYKTVTIGTQVWMNENLKVTVLNDGTNIPNVKDNTAWADLHTSGYCWYNNDLANRDSNGGLYNWYTVNTGKLCPTGWHVPTDDEWTVLTTHLGGESVAGGKLKEIGTAHWNSPNKGASNESGFTALPAGYCGYDQIGANFNHFVELGKTAIWWSSSFYLDTIEDMFWVYIRGITFDQNGVVSSDHLPSMGFSVRCLKGAVNQALTAPIVTIPWVTNFTSTTATVESNIVFDGGSSVIARGVCWSNSSLPTIGNNKTTDGTGIGIFTSSITGLSPNTTYYVRAYEPTVRVQLMVLRHRLPQRSMMMFHFLLRLFRFSLPSVLRVTKQEDNLLIYL